MSVKERLSPDFRFRDDVDVKKDFIGAQKSFDGSIEFVIYDTANRGDFRFVSITPDEARAMAQDLLEFAAQ